MQVYNDELYHFGKKGMKWGKRTTHGKIPVMLTKKRQLSADKKTLDKINNGDYHTSVGLNKSRQELYDKRDKSILEKRIDKNQKSKSKKTTQQHRAAGAKAAGSVLKFMGANVMAANRNNQAMRLSKMITPD